MYARPPPPCQQMSAGLNTTTRRASHPLPAVVKTSHHCAGRRGMRQGARSTALLPGMLLGACLHYSLYLDLGLESGLLPNGVFPKPLPGLNGSTWSGMSGGMVGIAPSSFACIPGAAKKVTCVKPRVRWGIKDRKARGRIDEEHRKKRAPVPLPWPPAGLAWWSGPNLSRRRNLVQASLRVDGCEISLKDLSQISRAVRGRLLLAATCSKAQRARSRSGK